MHDINLYIQFLEHMLVNGKFIPPQEATTQELLERFKENPDLLHAILEDAEGDNSIVSNEIDHMIQQLGETVNKPTDMDEAPKPNKQLWRGE
ncbi:MAG: hypothetical protein KDD76_04420 [Rickettsiales bacterium]|nr:hypothetical protein [Rickettsiales bacterium]